MHTFIITSTIATDKTVFSIDERYRQTVETIRSIKSKVPNSGILLIDNSTIDTKLPTEDVDVVYKLEHNLASTYVNFVGNKSKGELLLMDKALRLLKTDSRLSNCKRVFKITGRYTLSDDFDISYYDTNDLHGKFVAHVYPWFFQSFDLSEKPVWFEFFETGLWSMCSSLVDEYLQHTLLMYDHMEKTNLGIEETYLKMFPREKVICKTPVGVRAIYGADGKQRIY